MHSTSPPPLYRCQKCEYEFRFPSRETTRVPRMFGGGAVTACPRCYKEALRSVGMAVPSVAREAMSAQCARAYRVNYYD